MYFVRHCWGSSISCKICWEDLYLFSDSVKKIGTYFLLLLGRFVFIFWFCWKGLYYLYNKNGKVVLLSFIVWKIIIYFLILLRRILFPFDSIVLYFLSINAGHCCWSNLSIGHSCVRRKAVCYSNHSTITIKQTKILETSSHKFV